MTSPEMSTKKPSTSYGLLLLGVLNSKLGWETCRSNIVYSYNILMQTKLNGGNVPSTWAMARAQVLYPLYPPYPNRSMNNRYCPDAWYGSRNDNGDGG